MAAQYRYDVSTGVFVYSVEEGSAAERAGLKMGDVILKVDDNVIKTVEDLTSVKKQYAAGDTATLTVYREKQELTLELTWDAVPEDQQNTEAEQPQTNNQYGNQYGGGYYSPFDIFEYFFN
jgi:serine protease Do